MNHFAVVTDSSCDLPVILTTENDIHVVPFLVTLDGSTYKKDIVELDAHEFYQYLKDHPGLYPKTSMPSIADWQDCMKPLLEAGQDVLILCMSSKFTSSCQSAELAAEELLEDFPDRKVVVMDTTLATALHGLFALEACALRNEGLDIDAAVSRLDEIKQTGAIFFTVGDLDYLIHGGRVGKVKGLLGQMMHLKPMILMEKGELFPMGTVHTRKQSHKRIWEAFKKHVQENGIDLNQYSLITGYGVDEAEGEAFSKFIADHLAEEFGYTEPVRSIHLGAMLSVHTGPMPLGIGLIEKAVH